MYAQIFTEAILGYASQISMYRGVYAETPTEYIVELLNWRPIE